MKNLFAITLIITLVVASAMAAQEALQAEFNTVDEIDEEDIAAIIAASIPVSAEEEESALWKKLIQKHRDHHKHGKQGKQGKHRKHGKQKHKKCCIKYVTITSVPVCKPY
ncbi:hypothetical protein BG003_002964 [Podila horticola]|nr:hypothetical protein BG003_002964 [Podila horticola]